ncbi:hypothetical protein KQH82_08760 [bacterium]|nr:hypothetical protein [bacterium]
MKRFRVYIALAVLLHGGSGFASDDAGTESPFAFGAGARDLALSGASIAVADFATAPFWNPSRLARAEQYTIAGFHAQLYDSDAAYQYFGAVIPTLDFGTLGVGVFRLGVDGIERRDAGNLLIGDFSDSRLGFYLAYGKTFSGYDVGAALTTEHHSLDDYSATTSPGLTLSIGRRFESTRDWLHHVSATIKATNVIRPAMDLADETTTYPFAFEAGVAVGIVPGTFWDHELTLSAAVSKVDLVDARLKVGIEYSLAEMLHIRSGIRQHKLSFGVGLSYKAIRFDYALVDRDLGALHMFTLTSAFGKSVGERREERRAQQESEFNTLMSERLGSQNRETVDELVERGRAALDAGLLEDAVDVLDRARFMAVASRIDTTEIMPLISDARERLAESRRMIRYGQYLDSAQVELASQDYLSARYFANRALIEVPNSTDAQAILAEADKAISRTAAREETIETRLWTIDSLLSYGQVDQATSILRLLDEYAGSNEAVRRAQRRVTFEQYRQTAGEAYAREDYQHALRALDSAMVLFPGHQWCLDLRSRIRQDMRRVASRPVPEEPAATVAGPLSPELQREVESAYRSGQQAFQRGDLEAAISQWETVERLSPGYQSVRDYLVNAYKYVGVERYGKNQLGEAVQIWRKAAALAPDNKEIAGYIERTENEIRKLEELSYDQ